MNGSYLQCLYVFIACLGFGVIFNLRGKNLFLAALGATLGWFVYLLCTGAGMDDTLCYFVATVAIALYSEGMARLHKSPVTIYLVVSFLPLVPGSKIYYTMEYGMAGDTARFLQTGLETCKIAGAIVAGIALVSSVARLTTSFWRGWRRRRGQLAQPR